jgi:DNA-binding Xre family transcriptional regulator
LWLKDRLLERGWSNSDPAEYVGPDRKTVQKILRGEAVRNDVLQKLAGALSQKHGKVDVLDIPQD